MNTKSILWGLIFATMAIFSVLYFAMQEYGLAMGAIATGVIWLALEMNGQSGFGWLFFVAFLALAILGSLKDITALVILLGFCTNLAAWDLSRFRARLAHAANPVDLPVLETRHVQKLAVTACIGYFVAVLPVLVPLSINFVILCLILLVTVVMLRQAVFSLRENRQTRR